jgi:hypothetical protein
VLGDLGRDDEVRVGIPAQRLLRRAHLVLAQRRAVGLGRVLRVGSRERDVAPHDDERGPLRLGLRVRHRAADRREVVDVGDVLDVPAVGLEPRALVLLVEREGGRAVDRDAVVVVEEDDLPEPERARERGGLLAHTLHEVAVGGDRVDMVVDDLLARAVVALGEEALGHRHPHGVADALAERAGRRLDARREEVLRMPRRDRAPLAELLELLEREVVAGQVERRVLEDARVAGREDEPVAVGPLRIDRVEAQRLAVEDVGDGRQRHRGPGMARVRLLDGVHGERADRVDRQPLDVGAHKPPSMSWPLPQSAVGKP